MIFVKLIPGDIAGSCDGAEAKRVHDRNRPGSHRKNVPQDPAYAGGRALERLNE